MRIQKHIKKHHKKFAGAAGLGFSAFLLFASFFAVPGSILPKTSVGQVNVGGFSPIEAQNKLQDFFESYSNRKVIFSVSGKAYSLGLEELGVTLDSQLSASQTESVPDANIFKRVGEVIKALSTPREYKIVVKIDHDKMQNALVDRIPELEDPEKAQVKFFEVGKNSVAGYPADYKKIEKDVVETVRNFREAPIEISLLARQETEPAVEIAIDEKQQAELDSKRDRLLQSTLVLNAFLDEKKTIKVPLAEHPSWIRKTLTSHFFEITLNADEVREFITKEVLPQVSVEPQNAIITALPAEDSLYAKVEGDARAGYQMDIDETVQKIIDAAKRESFEIDLPVERVDGKIINETGVDLGELNLLSIGRSNFAGSPAGRDFNVRKALNEHYSNILLAPGQTFSYNRYLGGPVTNANGWKNSLAIFGGGSSLRPVPGGGLCQVSTTVYRAAVYAGLEIKKVKNHSLYVHYYVQYGEGLDSTIFPGQQDLEFINDTGNYVFIQSYAVGDDAFVNFYGTSDGRKVTLEGPFRYNEVPEGILYEKYGSPFRPNDIIWFQKIERADGIVEENQLVSRYQRAIPKKKG